MQSYEEVKKEIINIASLVDTFSPEIRNNAFTMLINSFLNEEKSESNVVIINEDLTNIAELTNNGVYKFTLRDPKAKNAKDAGKRIVYLVIRTYILLTGESGVSRKEILNEVLNNWNLNNGNTRSFITNDKGILKNGDILSLDKVAEKEADKYILQINDKSYLGKWKI